MVCGARGATRLPTLNSVGRCGSFGWAGPVAGVGSIVVGLAEFGFGVELARREARADHGISARDQPKMGVGHLLKPRHTTASTHRPTGSRARPQTICFFD